MKPKVLYAEDEPFLATIVSDGLRDNGYEVFWAENGQSAIEMIERAKPDICVLDITMPLKDGYTLAADIRKLNLKIPIIFVSAKSQPEEVIMGFKSGGNDYLKKPFSMDELVVRMGSLLARFEEQKTDRKKQYNYEFGSCVLQVVNQQLKTTSKNYTLSFKETMLLEMLIQRSNAVLERQDALITIWGDNSHYNSRSMDVFMANIRKILKDQPGIQLMSIRGVGYKLIC
ncbi:response regulator transcription factor [Mucilaginibacter sp. FT3.2]|uniref:response regulator transcription factor n=1 Tax=Mucilaginibacter sp. FT3.2 TaxID=2723090 RepID=UPI0016161BC4|nr:response regulator transcription factor [Mucilaginibacter sp. FT3.2]MBB6233607.1 DNA-binding response OmpR family regulator [Mucilaginibacter sp. FT3.2]